MLVTSLPKLHATSPDPLPFAPDVHVRAFVLERDAGDLLVYAAPSSKGLGDVQAQYLNHWHEAAYGDGKAEAPVLVHEADRAATEPHMKVSWTFSARTTVDDDFELIPIGGHTPGSTAFLWDSGGQRLLFTGDSVYLRGEEWVAAVLDSSDRAAYIESLGVISELEFDVLVPWAASADGPYYALTDPADTRARLDAIIDRISRGANH